ncbi:serine hydrolase [Flavitalea flava]
MNSFGRMGSFFLVGSLLTFSGTTALFGQAGVTAPGTGGVGTTAPAIERSILEDRNNFYFIDFKKYPSGDPALPIGVFDSGTGGLTILDALLTFDQHNNTNGSSGTDHIPDFTKEKFIYLADQANMPYGNYYSEHKTDLLIEHVVKDAQFLLSDKYYTNSTAKSASTDKQPIKALVIACNTATAYGKETVEAFIKKTGIDLKVIGVIDAGAKGVLDVFGKKEDGSIGVLATVGTIASKGYENTILRLKDNLSYQGNIKIFNQGGQGVAEAVDQEPDFINPKATAPRDSYRGPSLQNPDYRIDKTLMDIYRFDFDRNKMLCDNKNTDDCQILQLNSTDNYVRYHLVSLMEKIRKTPGAPPLKAIVLGCTHYPYLIKDITATLADLYNYEKDGRFIYRPFIQTPVKIIDPAVNVAKELYDYLQQKKLFNPAGDNRQSEFYITVPNKDNNDVKIDDQGRFTYAYKYGRNAGETQEYVKIVPFSNRNIPAETIERFKAIIPSTFELIKNFDAASPKLRSMEGAEKIGGMSSGGGPGSVSGSVSAGITGSGSLEAAFPVIDKIFADFAAKNHSPGLVYGLVKDGKLIYSGSLGFGNLEKKYPATLQSDFRIASMTKSFVSVAILQLRDAGKLRLDDPARLYIPELKDLAYLNGDAPELTLRNLLTHSAGFPEDNPWGDRQLGISDEALLAMVRKGISFSNSPGIAHEYSNMGFALLGMIIKKISGQPYEQYITQHILQPLGMDHTYWEYTAVPEKQLALGYRWLNGGWVAQPLLHDGAYGAMGGMITTMEDFSRYMAFHMAAWPSRSGKDDGPLKRSSLREMQQLSIFNTLNPHYTYPSGRVCPMASGYGYGLRTFKDCKGRSMTGHSGGLPGFGSNWTLLPDYGIGIISFSNVTYASAAAVNMYALDTLISLAGLEPRKIPVSPILEQRKKELIALLPNWDLSGAIKNIFAENFFLDYFPDSLKKEAVGIFAKAGKILNIRDLIAENALRGSFILEGENTDIEVKFTLTPENPALIQQYDIRNLSKKR